MRIFSTTICLLLTSATLASNIDPREYEWLIDNAPELDLFVATVQSDSSEDATYGNPPMVMLQVEEALRGMLANGQLTAEWPMVDDRPVCNVGVTRAETERWKAWLMQPAPGPPRGSRWVLAGYRGRSGKYRLSLAARYPYDPMLVDWFRQRVAAAAARHPKGGQ